MSKSLTDEQRIEMWEEIKRALDYSSGPRSGEFTIVQLMEHMNLNRNKLRLALNKLVESKVLGKRRGSYDSSSCNIYFPIQEMSMEELVEVLTK
jgi:hypothetical protein